jgi:hypothetical protein
MEDSGNNHYPNLWPLYNGARASREPSFVQSERLADMLKEEYSKAEVFTKLAKGFE